MKKCLSPSDVMDLSETQKGSLRDLWQPGKYDLAVEIVWKDVEKDLYDGVVLLVTDVRVNVIHMSHCQVLLKVLYLDSPPQYTCAEMETESTEGISEDSFNETTATNDLDNETDHDNDDQSELSTDIYRNKEVCLPLLSIGQMIEILTKHNSELNISFAAEEAICYIDGSEYSGDELCDALWDAVQSLL